MKFRWHLPISVAPFLKVREWVSLSSLQKDLFASIAVALLTIPQSIAYSLLAGLPPAAGLFSAIFGTIFSSTFGGSSLLISGPSTGVSILIQTALSEILTTHYENLSGPARDLVAFELLTQIVFLIGILQIVSSLLNVRKILQFVSRSVMLGYFAGITVAITINQLFFLFGISSPSSKDVSILEKGIYFLRHFFELDWIVLTIGLVSFIILFFFRKNFKNWPDALIMLVFASLLTYGFNSSGHFVMTLSDFHFTENLLPQFSWPSLNFKTLNQVFPAAMAIALLGILEVYSLSKNLSPSSESRSPINQDAFGIGIGNLFLSSITSALPCSGSATRTALNCRMGAKTKLSGILSGIFSGMLVYFCWPLVEKIPLTALAALLIVTVPTLTNLKEIKMSLKATREDAWVFGLTFFFSLIFRLDIAFFIGIAISIATYLKKSAEPQLVEYAFNPKGRLVIVSPYQDMHRKIRIIGIGGELYFAATDFFNTAMAPVIHDPNLEAIVLRLNNVHHMDASMCFAIVGLWETLQARGQYLLISGITDPIWQIFRRAGIVKKFGLDNLYFSDESNPQFSTWKACYRAQELIFNKKESPLPSLDE